MRSSAYEHLERILLAQVKDEPNELKVVLIVVLIHCALASAGTEPAPWRYFNRRR